MKKILTLLFATVFLAGCSPKEKTNAANSIRVGTIAGPETSLMETAKIVAKETYGLDVTIITFSDYIQPNTALAEGSLDANMFQHKPYLDTQIEARGYELTSVARTFIYPMGIYSKKITSLAQLKRDSLVGIPNDPTNEGRALLLLQDANLITLKPGAGLLATPADIIANTKKLRFKELDASLLPRTLNDLTIAVLNTNYATPAGLTPKADALFIEGADSPYANLLVVRTKDAHNKNVAELISALQSSEVLAKANALFPAGAAIPAWEQNTQ